MSNGRRRLLDPRYATPRLLASTIAGTGAALLSPDTIPRHIRGIVGWDVGALVFLALAWLVIVRATPSETRARAALEDPGRRVVFGLALASAVVSLLSAVTMLRQLRSIQLEQAELWTALALVAVVLSWLVTHTAFTLRYAHLYYEGGEPCLEFPDTHEPNDTDFAYFSFTIGMCFQVSDVTVRSRAARRAVLLHAVMSFGYNTAILALSLNLVTSLLQ